MDEEKLKLNMPLSISARDADRLIASGDGSCALLYLYLLRQGSGRGSGEAARALRLTPAQVSAAAEKLREMGLLEGGMAKLPPPEVLPEYTAEDVVHRAESDAAFRGVLEEAERLLGRTLSGADLKLLFGVYDHLGLPPEVILLLLHHCVEEYREKYGPGRLPTLRWVEKEAYIWANREIMTLSAAEDYLRLRGQRREQTASLARTLGIRDRELTPSEKKYIEGWLELGFPPEALELAYDRTVMGTGSLKWPYMNKILLSWDSKNLHTVEEIQKGDGPRRPAPAAPAPDKSGTDLERMKKIYDKVRNGR